MLFYCWGSVYDAGPALKQHRLNPSLFLLILAVSYLPIVPRSALFPGVRIAPCSSNYDGLEHRWLSVGSMASARLWPCLCHLLMNFRLGQINSTENKSRAYSIITTLQRWALTFYDQMTHVLISMIYLCVCVNMALSRFLYNHRNIATEGSPKPRLCPTLISNNFKGSLSCLSYL